MTGEITLRVEGPPVGWQRARVNHAQRRHYDDPKTTIAQAAVVASWTVAGRPRVESFMPLAFTLEAALERPKNHFLKAGQLGAIGNRCAWPVRKPDTDNLLKLSMDALNGLAYHDDAQVVHAWALKRWCRVGETPHTLIGIRTMPDYPEAA